MFARIARGTDKNRAISETRGRKRSVAETGSGPTNERVNDMGWINEVMH